LAGLELYIPPGALEKDTVITIGEVVDGAPTLSGCFGYSASAVFVSLEPSGLTFKKPVTIQIPLPAELLHEGNNITAENVTLKKYNKDLNTWKNIPVKYVKDNAIVAEIKSFCWVVGLAVLWRCGNPACDRRILEQAREWRMGDRDEELKRILQDTNMFVDSDVTFADKIGHLLLAEAWWEKIKDGEFHDGANIVRIVAEEAAKEIAKDVAVKLLLEKAGLGALKVSSKASIPVTVAFRYGIKTLDELGTNAQLRVYLSWRGWFFENGQWVYNNNLSQTHSTAMQMAAPWFISSRCSKGIVRPFFAGIYVIPLKALHDPNYQAEDFFRDFGEPLYDLLHQADNNEIVADRERLRRMFRFLEGDRPVANAGPDLTAYVNTPVILDGSASSDPNNDDLRFRWYSYPAGKWPPMGRNRQLELLSTVAGVSTLQLVVDDGLLQSIPDMVIINRLPRADNIQPGDITPPTINSFSVEPVSVTAGSPVTIRFTAEDNAGGSELSRIVLNRAKGDSVYWEAIAYYCFDSQDFFSLKGNNRKLAPWPWDGLEVSGAFKDTPPSAGTFWYGITVIDKAGNLNCEQNSRTNNQPGDFGPDKVQVEINQDAMPDLTIISVALSKASAQVGDTVSVTFTVENRGGPLTDDFQNVIFLSTKQFGGHGAQNFLLRRVPMSLDGATSRTETVEVAIPDVAAGDWYVAVYTDGTVLIDERNEGNNIDSRAITVTAAPPDEVVPLTGINITPPAMPLVVGATHQFTASPVPANAILGQVTWSVDNTAIGTIDANGLFIALAAGTTTVRAASLANPNIAGTAVVTVSVRHALVPSEITHTIAAGIFHSLAIRRDGTLWAWGWNANGELGDGTNTTRLKPVQVLTDVASVAAAGWHSLAIRHDGTLWAWGGNSTGQLGDGTTTTRFNPVQVLTDVAFVAAAATHSLAIRHDGTLWAWGNNWAGHLGDGTTATRLNPVQVLTDVASVAAEDAHSLATRHDGTLWAWGDNRHGQLGDGTTATRLNPVHVLTDVVSVAAGSGHSLAIRGDRTLWAWGNNWFGQLGDGTNTTRLNPVQVLTDVVSIAAGCRHSLAIRTDGTLWAWGCLWERGWIRGWSSIVPVHVLTDVVSVAAGAAHSLAIRNDGTLWAWGLNEEGQLGDGTTTNRHVHVQVLTDVLTPAPPVAAPQLRITSPPTPPIQTSTAPYDATLSLTGANFNNVNQVVFTWSGAASGSETWNRGDVRWNEAVTVHSATSMTLVPRVIETHPAWSGTANWTLTLRDTTGATASQSFSVTYTPLVRVTGMTVTTETATINIGATQQLTAIVLPENATNKDVTWSSSDPAIATVDANGLVTGVAPGTATVTATSAADPTISDTAAVTVAAALQPAVAGISLSQAVDGNGIVVIPVKVTRVMDPATGTTVNIPGGLGAYKAKITTSPEGGIQVLEVRGTDYFPNVTFDPATGIFAASQAPAPGQPNNTAVAKLVLRLTGSAEVSHNITVTFQEIVAAKTGLKVPAEKPISLTFRRGDANGDGRVNIVDAMFIAQKVVGIRGLDTVNALNAASVRHDGAGGDRVNIVDAMFIAQHVVGIRDKYFE
jgi:alpha-tubulin suppressor-like RCC1 family protein